MTATVEQVSLETLTSNVVDSIESKLVIDDAVNDMKSLESETSESTVNTTTATLTATTNEGIDKLANSNNNGVSATDTNGVGLDAKQKKKYDKLAGEL